MTVSIPNPDDPLGMPLYEGEPEQAHERLIPGIYPATWYVGDEVVDAAVIVLGPEGPTVPSLGLAPQEARTSFLYQYEVCTCPIPDRHSHTVWYYVGFAE